MMENIFFLYAVHIFNYGVPLLMIPWLTRHLGLAAWGEFALAEAMGRYVSLFIEYGFSLSGTREVARYQHDAEYRSSLLAGVLGGQCALAGASLLVAFAMSFVLPGFRESPLLFWSAIVWGVLDAFNLMWYFQGIEQARRAGMLDIAARALGVFLIFLAVHNPDDGWKAFAARGIASALSLALCTRAAYAAMPLRKPAIVDALNMLRQGFSMFLLRSSINLYLLSNVLVLGLFVPPQIVGLYSGAEKISRAAVALLNPITQAVYPRVSRIVHSGAQGAGSLVRISMAVMGGGGLLTALSVFLLAPFIVRVLLGKGFEEAIPILRFLCILHPLVALNNVLGIQWLIPHGLDRKYNMITVGAGAVNVLAGMLLVPDLMQFGVVWSTILAEGLMFLAIAAVCVRLDINPIRLRTEEPAASAI